MVIKLWRYFYPNRCRMSKQICPAAPGKRASPQKRAGWRRNEPVLTKKAVVLGRDDGFSARFSAG